DIVLKLKYIWISIRCPFVIFNTQLNNGNLLGQLDEFKQYDRLIIFVFGIFIMVFAIIVMITWFIFFYRGILIGFRSEEHTSELQSRFDIVCRLLLEKKK